MLIYLRKQVALNGVMHYSYLNTCKLVFAVVVTLRATL